LELLGARGAPLGVHDEALNPLLPAQPVDRASKFPRTQMPLRLLLILQLLTFKASVECHFVKR